MMMHVQAYEKLKKTCIDMLALAEKKQWDEFIDKNDELITSMTLWVKASAQEPLDDEDVQQKKEMVNTILDYHKKIQAVLQHRQTEIADLLEAADQQRATAGFGRSIEEGTYPHPGKKKHHDGNKSATR